MSGAASSIGYTPDLANSDVTMPRSSGTCVRSTVLTFKTLGKLRKTAYGRSRLFFGNSELVQFLQVQPEFGAGPEEMRQAKRTISGNRALAVQNSSYPVGRHLELSAEFGSAHTEFCELFGEMLAGMNCTASHGVPHLW